MRTFVYLLLLISLLACASPGVQDKSDKSQSPELTTSHAVMADGYKLPVTVWAADTGPEAIVIALHGFNDYRNAFDGPAHFFSANGITTYAYDQRGFGETAQRGIWPDNNALEADGRLASPIPLLGSVEKAFLNPAGVVENVPENAARIVGREPMRFCFLNPSGEDLSLPSQILEWVVRLRPLVFRHRFDLIHSICQQRHELAVDGGDAHSCGFDDCRAHFVSFAHKRKAHLVCRWALKNALEPSVLIGSQTRQPHGAAKKAALHRRRVGRTLEFKHVRRSIACQTDLSIAQARR